MLQSCRFFFRSCSSLFPQSEYFPHTSLCCGGGRDECGESGCCTILILSPPVKHQQTRHESKLLKLFGRDQTHLRLIWEQLGVFHLWMVHSPPWVDCTLWWAVRCFPSMLCSDVIQVRPHAWVWSTTCFLDCGHFTRKYAYILNTESSPWKVLFCHKLSVSICRFSVCNCQVLGNKTWNLNEHLGNLMVDP